MKKRLHAFLDPRSIWFWDIFWKSPAPRYVVLWISLLYVHVFVRRDQGYILYYFLSMNLPEKLIKYEMR
jgi:hypothetical protein